MGYAESILCDAFSPGCDPPLALPRARAPFSGVAPRTPPTRLRWFLLEAPNLACEKFRSLDFHGKADENPLARFRGVSAKPMKKT